MPLPLVSIAILERDDGKTAWVLEKHTDPTGGEHYFEVTYPSGTPIDRDLTVHATNLAERLADSEMEDLKDGELNIKYQTLEEFTRRLKEKYYQSSGDNLVKIAKWLYSLMITNPPLIEDSFVIGVLEVTPEKWAETKAYVIKLVEAEELLKTATGI